MVSRPLRGAYNRSERLSEPAVRDSHDRVVRAVGKTQTFLSVAEVDKLVAADEQGMTPAQFAERFASVAPSPTWFVVLYLCIIR